jgi:hypothetical protein
MKSAVACGAIILALNACHPRPITEQKLIGTWVITAAVKHEEDGSEKRFEMAPDMEITFTPDHKELWRSSGTDRQAVARWHLEGHDLVFTMETESEMGGPGTTKRGKIKSITTDELVFSDGSVEGWWKRVR